MKERRKILIVDDNKNIRSLVRRVIDGVSSDMFDIQECSDGAEAVISYAASQSDLIIMDIAMPQKDGIAAAEEITSHDRSARIIFLTQHPVSEYSFLKKRPGVMAVISKEDVGELQKELKLFFPK